MQADFKRNSKSSKNKYSDDKWHLVRYHKGETDDFLKQHGGPNEVQVGDDEDQGVQGRYQVSYGAEMFRKKEEQILYIKLNLKDW